MKLPFFFFLLALCPLIADAQRPSAGAGVSEAGPMPGFSIAGRVVDSTTGQAVPYASVSVLRVADSALVGGNLVNDAGNFRVDKLPGGTYLLKINFLGYRTTWSAPVSVSAAQPVARVGQLIMTEANSKLKEVVVDGERPIFQLGIDRKTFDVARSNLTPGGTATDVLATVPTVTVDVDGNVSMRNNDNVTIYIDGRPSGITASNRAAVLRQIPASAIERIELITSPSARYDAEGTAGIINIILKKNKLQGLNGSVQQSVGTQQKYNTAANVAYRNTWVNAYVNYNFRSYRRTSAGDMARSTRALDTATRNYPEILKTWSANNSVSTDRGHFLKTGADFTLPKNNLLGVSLSASPGEAWNKEQTGYLFYRPGAERPFDSSTRESYTVGKNDNYDVTLSHVKKYDTKGFEWTSIASYADFANINTFNILQLGDLITRPGQGFINSPYQKNPLAGRTRVLTAQTDYVRPLDEKRKVEFGLKSSTRDIYNDQKYFIGSDAINLTPIDSQTNNFSYNEQVVTGYGIFQQKLGKVGYQAGLRYEHTYINTRSGQASRASIFNARNYGNLIPTVNINYAHSSKHEFQLSYAQRLSRPGPGSLNPFTDFSDPNTLRVGNPDLIPELIHAFEGNWQLNTQAVSLTSTAFFRYNASLLTRVIDVGADGRAIVTERNTGPRQDAGTEFTGRWQVAKGYSLTGNTSLFYSYIDASNVSNGLVRRNVNYTLRLTGIALVRAGTNIQATAFYRSPFILPQGQSQPFYNVDVAASQEFYKKKASIALAVSDIFNTLRFGVTTSDRTFRHTLKRKRETQIATLTLSYRFGSLDNLSRRRETRSSGGGGGDFGF